MTDPIAIARDLLSFIDSSPTPYHCAAEAAARLGGSGFTEVSVAEPWTLVAGRGYFFRRGGLLVAWRQGLLPAVRGGFRLIGAHTDSPNLRLKPRADLERSGFLQLGVEVYGGALTYTWLDRDLSLAGRVIVRADDGRQVERLLHVARPLLRIPSLAIHLDRSQRDKLELNDQKHLVPVWGLSAPASTDGQAKNKSDEGSALRRFLGAELNVEAEAILTWELMLCDTVPATLGGRDNDMIFAPRLDNQGSCHAALSALQGSGGRDATQVICLYDHEEIGSGSTVGAEGAEVENLLRRLAEVDGPGAEPGGLPRAIARSLQISADMAHALHPNHSDRHEPEHQPRLNGGPVIKWNSQQRYATDAETGALFAELCAAAQVPVQHFVVRSDLPCGSTIGPLSSARLGVRTVDVGNPMLSMHSIREQCGAKDQAMMIEVMRRFFEA